MKRHGGTLYACPCVKECILKWKWLHTIDSNYNIFWKTKTMKTVKRQQLLGAGGRRTRKVFTVKHLQDTIIWIHVIISLLKPKEV